MTSPRQQNLPESYSSHLTEGIRLETGRMLIAREAHKLASCRSLADTQSSIDRQLGSIDNDVHIRDFWNLAHALTMGYKLKDTVCRPPWFWSDGFHRSASVTVSLWRHAGLPDTTA